MTEGSGGSVVVAYKDRKIFLWNPELSGADSRGEHLFSDDEALKIQEEVFGFAYKFNLRTTFI